MTSVDTSLFKPELVFLDFDARDRADCFNKLGVELKARGYVKDTWLGAIKAREESYPTGLPCQAINVAIPHTDSEHLNKPYIAIVRPRRPIDFQGMGGMCDRVPAELIVNLGLLAHADEQVAALQALMQVFMDEEQVARVRAQKDAEGMVRVMREYCGA